MTPEELDSRRQGWRCPQGTQAVSREVPLRSPLFQSMKGRAQGESTCYGESQCRRRSETGGGTGRQEAVRGPGGPDQDEAEGEHAGPLMLRSSLVARGTAFPITASVDPPPSASSCVWPIGGFGRISDSGRRREE